MTVRDTDFMNELQAAIHEKPSRPLVVLLYSLAALVTVLILWAAVTKIEELTKGQGQVVPTREVQIVQSLEGGILQELLVAEGDRVKKGQILLRISDVQFSSEERGTEARSLALQGKKTRLLAESGGKELSFTAEFVKSAQDRGE